MINNILYTLKNKIVLIDFGLSFNTSSEMKKVIDLNVLERCFSISNNEYYHKYRIYISNILIIQKYLNVVHNFGRKK